MIKKILKWVCIGLATLIAGVLIYSTIKQSRHDARVEEEFQPTGKFSDIGRNKVHYRYLGEGDFTFVLIAGLGESMHTWSTIEKELSERGQVFMYDRSGLGFSEEGVLPRSVDNASIELHTILENENIQGPYVLVGHSVGGFIARYYAKKYPDDILGLFLIDPYQGDVGEDLGAKPLAYRMMNWSFRNMSWSGIPFALLPEPPHPVYKTSRAIKTYALEGHAEEVSLKQFAEIGDVGSDMPLCLLKADNKRHPYNELNNKWSKQIFDKYSSDKNRYKIVESGHHIHIQKPDAVLSALDEFIPRLVQDSLR